MAVQNQSHPTTDHGYRRPRSGKGGSKDGASQVVSKRNPRNIITFGTWNVRSMFEPGKLHNINQEIQRLNVDILGISETRWTDSGSFPTNNGMIYYSGNNDINHRNHRNGVAVIVSKRLLPFIRNFTPVSDRLIFLQLQINATVKLNILQTYAPTADKSDEEIESFYQQIEQILKSIKSRDVTVILGDFNAKIGQGKSGKYVGEYGLGIRNERGDRLLQFCQENDLVITNTFFKLPKRRLYTWTSPQDNDYRIARNQIDFILVNERFRNSIKSVKTYPGADISSDHNPLIARMHIKFKKLVQKTDTDQIDTSRLQNLQIKEELKRRVNNNLKLLSNNNTEDIENKWQNLKMSLIEPAKKLLKKEKARHKQEWITDKILELMEKRRLAKDKCRQKYKEIHKQIRTEIRAAKETYYRKKCQEIEELQAKYDIFNVHKKVKELANIQNRKHPNVLQNANGEIITDLEEKLKTWKNYVEELFDDERQKPDLNRDGDEGPEITKAEIKYAIKTIKTGKAPGPDELPSEILKLVEDESMDTLVDLFNLIYKKGIIPKEWLLSTFVTIPKKAHAKECTDHRTISLMSHTLKIFLKVIHNRIYKKLEMDISDTQFGFRSGLGTREALFALNVMSQRCLDINQDMYLCFIDYNKAFDRVRHDHLMKLLEEKNLDRRDIAIILNLYYNQRASIRVERQSSEEIEIKKGVRQGCILSPLLFNVYSENIINKAFSDQTIGIKINGIPINNLRYADDTVLIAETAEDLQILVDRIVEYSEQYGLSLNIKKTKVMLISKTTPNFREIYVHGEAIERVRKYNYLGTSINENNESSEEIKIRIEKARAIFTRMKRVFTARDLSLEIKVRLVRCYILSVLFYGMETWTLKKADTKKLEAFEMWIYRRILKISWTERVPNEEVLRKMNKEKEVLLTIKKRKLQYLGHVMRGEKYQLLQLIVQGKIVGKRSIGRRRNSWMKNLREWYNCSNNQLFRSTVSKIRIALMIANLRNEDGT